MTEKNQTGKKLPMRECVGCRESKPKKELVRVIRNEDQMIELDLTGKKNGRGAYICRNAECLTLAIKHKGLERSLKTAISDEVYEKLREELMS